MEIKVVLATLAEVAALEERLVAARDARDRHTRRDDHLGELARELEADSRTARAAVDEAQAALRRLDRELKDVELAMSDRRARLAGVADDRQAMAVRNELASFTRRREALEAEAMGLLASLERAEAVVGEAESDRLRQEGRTRTELGTLSAAADRGAEALAAGVEEMERLLALLPPDLTRHLRRLQGRDGRGVAQLRDGVCDGCYGHLPAALAAEVARRQTVVKCTGCARIII